MKAKKYRYSYSVQKPIRYAYPNAAEPGYLFNKILDYITVAVSGFGLITTLLFLATM